MVGCPASGKASHSAAYEQRRQVVFQRLNQTQLDAEWRTLRRLRFMLRVLLLLLATIMLSKLAFTCASRPQERPEPPANKELGHDGTHGPLAESAEDKNFPEAEFVGSSKFRSFSYVQPLVSGLNFEGHYFGVEDVDVGTLNGSWTFRLGKSVKLSPGFGVYFGENQRTGPAFTFRWEIEKGPLVSQGLFIQGFRKVEVGEGEEEQKSVYPNIWDGNHISLRYKRFEVGPAWERIHTREGNEWKGGGRVAVHIFPHMSAVMFVMAPETEVRGGVIIHPTRREE